MSAVRRQTESAIAMFTRSPPPAPVEAAPPRPSIHDEILAARPSALLKAEAELTALREGLALANRKRNALAAKAGQPGFVDKDLAAASEAVASWEGKVNTVRAKCRALREGFAPSAIEIAKRRAREALGDDADAALAKVVAFRAVLAEANSAIHLGGWLGDEEFQLGVLVHGLPDERMVRTIKARLA